MKNKITILAATVAALVSFTASVQAVPITGSITMAGGVTLNTSSAGTATAILSWTGPGGVGLPFVIFSTLSAGAVAPGTGVTFVAPKPFVSGPVAGFWSVGGYVFNLTSSSIFSQGGSPASVTVVGTGFITKAGFDATPGTWALSTQDPSSGTSGTPPAANFSFSSATGALVPDGGTTVLLLGAALSGLSLFRKKMLA